MITPELQELYAGDTGARYVETLSLSHPDFTQEWHLTSDPEPWTFLLEDGATSVDYTPFPFLVVEPERSTDGQVDLNIALCNVTRELVEQLERAIEHPRTAPQIAWRVYLDKPNTTPQRSPLILSITDITADMGQVTATATRYDVLSRAFPGGGKRECYYNTDTFPGLRR